MSTTNLNIENVFPDYELLDTAATKASITDAIDTVNEGDERTFTITDTNGVVNRFRLLSSGTTLPTANLETTDIEVVIGGTQQATRDRIRIAINGTEDANVYYGDTFDSAEGVQGVKATNGTAVTNASLQREFAGATSLVLTDGGNSLVTAAGLAGATGTSAAGAIKIPLDNLTAGSNELTVAETQDLTGDYRKLLFHITRSYHTYLQTLESVASIGITTGGTLYAAGDTLVFSGGSPTVAATGTIATVGSGGEILTFSINGGSGYSTAPLMTITTTAGVNGVLYSTLSTHTPEKLTIAKGALVENASTGIINRSFTSTFGLDESGLELATD